VRPVYYLSAFVPAAVALKLSNAAPALVFFSSALAVVPAAALMSDATEELSARATRGGWTVERDVRQRPELIITFFALLKGLQEVVKAALVGSVIGNSLLVLGRGDAGRLPLTTNPASEAAADPEDWAELPAAGRAATALPRSSSSSGRPDREASCPPPIR
jgi:hypothetical protein